MPWVDVDHFKSFNDTYGHAAGDQLLRVIASALGHSFRKTDIVGRYGGEEFVIAMPETNAAAGGRKLEGFRQLIATTPIQAKDGNTVNVTVSGGAGRVSARRCARGRPARRRGRTAV